MTQLRVVSCRAADKSNSNRMRAAGLRLAAHVVEALPYLDRNTAAVQAEAWRLLEKQVKVSHQMALAYVEVAVQHSC